MRFFPLGKSKAAFTDRRGGVSQGPYASLNLGRHTGDSEESIWLNRERLASAIGRDIMWMNQMHSARVMRVRPGFTSDAMICDAMVLDSRQFTEVGLSVPALAVEVADCVPLLLSSDDGTQIGVAHVGRENFVSGIVRAVVDEFTKAIPAARIRAAVGPSICGHCYEVPEAMRDSVSHYELSTYAVTDWHTPGLDIRQGVVSQLRRLGVDVTFVSKRCTYEDEALYSYRRDQVTGRFCGLVIAAS